ncbi:MAG: hypothetical protein ACOH18_05435 [Candidatus Saccharimonadaceae bacterium]
MTKTKAMQDRDRRMFDTEVRDAVYRGPDDSWLTKGEIATAQPIDHGARPLIGKFSQFNLSYLTPEQRKLFVEQLKYEMTLSGAELNSYLAERYSDEDMYQVWLMQQNATKTGKIAKKSQNKGLKRRISNRKRAPVSPEEMKRRTEKAKATRLRNKNDPNHVSYATLKVEFRRKQKLLAQRAEIRMKQAIAVYAEPEIQKQVKRRTAKLVKQNQLLKEQAKLAKMSHRVGD